MGASAELAVRSLINIRCAFPVRYCFCLWLSGGANLPAIVPGPEIKKTFPLQADKVNGVKRSFCIAEASENEIDVSPEGRVKRSAEGVF